MRDPEEARIAALEIVACQRFVIYKTDDDAGPWYLDYSDGFDEHSAGEHWDTFDEVVAAFVAALNRRCINCDRGAVQDRPWGWECAACGSHDVATGFCGASLPAKTKAGAPVCIKPRSDGHDWHDNGSVAWPAWVKR